VRELLRPTFAEERTLHRQGYRLVAGIDEAGRGALAGPVAAAAVILPQSMKAAWLRDVRDSKLLSPEKREHLFYYINGSAVSVGVGLISRETIDEHGIAKATYTAMRVAVSRLSPPAQALLVDYFRIPDEPLPQKGVPEGDTLCMSIACASIVAKVTRDRLMVELDAKHSGYGFARHKGYGTDDHLENLRRLGPCPIHRRSFLPVREAAAGGHDR
jgi:ribonuclease HII